MLHVLKYGCTLGLQETQMACESMLHIGFAGTAGQNARHHLGIHTRVGERGHGHFSPPPVQK